MSTRKINITFEIEDNDMVQYKFELLIYNAVGQDKVKDLRVLPNTNHLKDNQHYKALRKAEKVAKKLLYEFISSNG